MDESLEIAVQPTPNPNAMKFTLNRAVASQGTTYRPTAPQGAEAAVKQPAWVRQLLNISGVMQVFALNNFISVNKAPEADWAVIGPEIERVLHQAFH